MGDGPAQAVSTANPDAPQASALQTLLREATKEVHGRIDSHPLLSVVARGKPAQEAYSRALRVLDWIWRDWQPILEQDQRRWLGDDGALLSPRTAWLAQDLAALAIPPLDIAPQPPAPARDAAEAAGRLYVAEGATLGGWRLYQRLAPALGLNSHSGARYFHGHGEATQRHWRRVWEILEASPARRQPQQAADAARTLFADLERRLDLAAARLR